MSINPLHLSKPLSHDAAQEQNISDDEIESIYELIAQEICDTDIPESDDEDVDSTSPLLELFYTEPSDNLSSFCVFLVHNSRYHNIAPSIYRDPQFLPPQA